MGIKSILSNSVVDSAYIMDVAAGYNPDTMKCNREIALVDSRYSRVYVYDIRSLYSFYRRSEPLLTVGNGSRQVNHPTSACYARDPITGYNLSCLYVTDAGNKRVVMLNTKSPADTFFTTTYEFPQHAYLSSVDVDNFGYVYVVDYRNSVAYLFNPTLSTLIATFGSKGTGDGELYMPCRLKVAEGWNQNTYPMRPLIFGDAFVTESFTAETGIRRYVLGNDILWHQATFTPRPIPEGYDVLRCDWIQSGATSSYRYLYHNGQLLKSDTNRLNLPGEQYMWYMTTDYLERGYYTFEIRTKSVYDASFQTTFRDSVYIVRSSCGYDSSSWKKFFYGYMAIDAIEAADGGFFLLGDAIDNIDGNIVIQKTDACGNGKWIKSFTNLYSQWASSFQKMSDGGFLVAGGAALDASGKSHICLTKTDSTGVPIWTKIYGSGNYLEAYDLEKCLDGNYMVAGYADDDGFLLKVSAAGDSLWFRKLPTGIARVVKPTPDRGYIVAGYSTADRNKAHIIKANQNGDTLWTRTLAGSIDDAVVAADGGYVFTGLKDPEIWLLKLNTSGNEVWNKNFRASPRVGGGGSIEMRADGGFIIGGQVTLEGSGEFDFYVAVTNACGDTIWTKTYENDTTSEVIYATLATSDSGFVLAGLSGSFWNRNALVIRGKPERTQLQFVCGDANGDGKSNLIDILYLISFKFRGGAPPVLLEAMDVNGDCIVNLMDILRMITRQFKGGPPYTCPY